MTLNINIKTDAIELMKCKNCKYFNKGCIHVSEPANPESSCIDWDKKEFNEEEKKVRESQVVLSFAYKEILKVLKEYVDMQEKYAKIISIWTIGTYFHEKFGTYPFLFFNAMRGSAKTRTLKLVASIGAKGDGSVQNNISEAALFRIERGTTTCFDEVEQISNKEKQTMRELFNSAYKKGMKVRRVKKVKKRNAEGNLEENQIVEEFEPYFPIAMANINGIEEVLADRAITIVLEKSNHPIITKMHEDFLENAKIRWLKLTLGAFSSDVAISSYIDILKKWNFWLRNNATSTNTTNATTTTTATNATSLLAHPLLSKYGEFTKEDIIITPQDDEFFKKLDSANITGRNFELFTPLLIIGKFIGDDTFNDIFLVIQELIKDKKSEEYNESKDVLLFNFLLTQEETNEYINLKDLTKEFRTYMGEDDNEDKWLNERWFSHALKRLNLVLDKRRYNGHTQVTLNYIKAREKLKIFKW